MAFSILFVILVFVVAVPLFILAAVAAVSALIASRGQSVPWGKVILGGLSVLWLVPVLLVGLYVAVGVFWNSPRSTPATATIVMPQPLPTVSPNPQQGLVVKIDDDRARVALQQAVIEAVKQTPASTPAVPATPPVTVQAGNSAKPSEEKPVPAAASASASSPQAEAPVKAEAPLRAEAPIQAEVQNGAAATAQPAPAATATVPAAEPLPDWVDDKESVIDGKRLIVLISQQYATPADADRDILNQARGRIHQDLRQNYRYQGSPPIHHSTVEGALVRRHVLPVVRRTGTGDNEFVVYRVYRQLEISPTLRTSIERNWRQQNGEQRLWGLGTLAGFVTLVLGTVFAYLRLDTRTGSHYRGRLRFAALCLIMAGGAVAISVVA